MLVLAVLVQEFIRRVQEALKLCFGHAILGQSKPFGGAHFYLYKMKFITF
jgi:hypothetical protein